MREGWKEVKLRDVAEIKYGKDHKKLGEGTYPLYGSGGIMRYVDSYLSEEESILIPRKGTLSNLFYLNQPFSTVDTMFWTKINSSIVVPRFLYYLLKTYDLASFDEGAAIPSLTTKTLNVIKIKVPPLSTQKKIADILSAYDDLIENNLKRIQLLEEQTQLMYDEWFVRMKFPGYETAKINEETGLPEGWEINTIDVLCEKITDGTHDSPKQAEEGYYLVTGKNLSNGFVDFNNAYLISETDHFKIKKRSGLNKGDILFSNIGTLGNVAIVTEDFEYSCKNVIIFKKKEKYSNFLYYYLCNPRFLQKLDNYAAGVAQKFYSLGLIRNLKEIIPAKDLIELFDSLSGDIIKQKINFQKQNRLLQEARDLLLPRLMMGMIDVEEERLGMVAEERGEYKTKK